MSSWCCFATSVPVKTSVCTFTKHHSQLTSVLVVQAIASVDREEMFGEHMKERERRKRAEEKAARKRKLQDFKELLQRTSYIKVACTQNVFKITCWLAGLFILVSHPLMHPHLTTPFCATSVVLLSPNSLPLSQTSVTQSCFTQKCHEHVRHRRAQGSGQMLYSCDVFSLA